MTCYQEGRSPPFIYPSLIGINRNVTVTTKQGTGANKPIRKKVTMTLLHQEFMVRYTIPNHLNGYMRKKSMSELHLNS